MERRAASAFPADAGDHGTGIHALEPTPEGMKTVTGPREIERGFSDYLHDESRVQSEGVEAILFPLSPGNVAFVLREAAAKGKKVTVSGGRTGICAGAVPLEGGVLLSLERMNRVLGVRREGDEYRLTAQGGLRLSELNQRVASRELGIAGAAAEEFSADPAAYFYPPDPTEQSASLAGTVATNASGARTLFFGPTRGYVAGIDVVLPGGDFLRVSRGDVREEGGFFRVPRTGGEPLLIPAPAYEMPATKNSAGLYSLKGMDLIDLFVGSEGILGVIVNVTVRLLREPLALLGGVAFFPGEEESLDFVRRARRELGPLALEYFDGRALALLEETRRAQGPTSEIPEAPVFEGAARGDAVYFESAVFADRASARGDGGDGGTSAENGLPGLLRRWRSLIRSSGGDAETAWGAVTKRDILRLKAFRHALPEAVNRIVSDNRAKDGRIHKVGTDIAVPDDRLADMMGFYRSLLGETGIDHVIFGHIGDNHVHVNMLPRDYGELLEAKSLYTKFATRAVSLGGSVSAEHGIGKLKREHLALQYPRSAIEQMRAVKAALDPGGVLNPGDVI